MTRTERIASAYVGRRLELLRLDRGITAEEMGSRIGMHPKNYRLRELGMRLISLDFLLRCNMILGPSALERFWFPVEMRVAAVDDMVIVIQVGIWERQAQPVTYEQIIELCAEAFGVPTGAITGGLGNAKVRKARTAAALIVASRPHLRVSELASYVGRSRRNLWWMRKQALEADEDLLRRVEQIQREVDAL